MSDAQTFEAHKDEILALYITEDKPLKDVILQLKTRGLHKNKGQYERQLKKWRISKNAKANDWKIVHHKIKFRKQQDKLAKESRHDIMGLDDYGERSQSPMTPEGFTINTPMEIHVRNFSQNWPVYRMMEHIVALDIFAGSKLFQPNYAGNNELPVSISSFMHNTIAGRTKFTFLGEIALDTMHQPLLCVIYLASNCLLNHDHIRDLVLYLKHKAHVDLLERIISCQSPSAKATARALLPEAIEQDNVRLIEVLLASGFNVSALVQPRIGSPRIALAWAAELGRCAAIKLILDRTPTSERQVAGQFSLYMVARSGRSEIVRFLLDYGVNVASSPIAFLPEVLTHGHFDIARLLIDTGADVNQKDTDYSEHKMMRMGFNYIDLDFNGGTPLQIAVKLGAQEVISALLDHQADGNICANDHYGTPTQEASLRCDVALVRRLLLLGADINAAPGNSYRCPFTVLQAAVLKWGADSDVAFLLTQGADPNALPGTGDRAVTALQASAKRGDLERTKLLLQYGADLNPVPMDTSKRELWLSPLLSAVEAGHVEVAIFLIRRGASITPHDHADSSRILVEAVILEHIELVELLLSHGADVNQSYNSEWCSLTPIQGVNSVEIANLLLSYGADVNAPAGRRYDTALQAAVRRGNSSLVRALIDAGADVNAAPAKYDGRSALGAAIEHGDVDLVRLLLKAGAELNCLASNIDTIPIPLSPLQLAIWMRDNLMTTMLLQAGADVNFPAFDEQGMTALQVAASRRAGGAGPVYDLVRLLLDHGADVNAKGAHWGMNALQAATDKGIELVRLLLEHGADVNAEAAEHGGITALQGAAIAGDIEMVCLLIDKGADVNAPKADREGRTALEGAAEHGRLDIAQLLLNHGAETAGSEALELARDQGHDGVVSLLQDYFMA